MEIKTEINFEGVLSATARKLQDFLSFKKSVPEKFDFSFNSLNFPNVFNYYPTGRTETGGFGF